MRSHLVAFYAFHLYYSNTRPLLSLGSTVNMSRTPRPPIPREASLAPVPNTEGLVDKLRTDPAAPLQGADRIGAGLLTPGGELTIAGALVLADIQDPSLPHLLLHYRRWEAGRAEVLEGAITPIEDFFVPGPLSDAVPELAEGLVAHAPVRLKDPGLSRQLFDELLVNAIGHRSFGAPHVGSPVHIEHYTDTIHFRSPGPLVKEVSATGGSIDGRRSRNPMLMAFLTRQGLARQMGLGLAWARKLAPQLGYRIHHEVDDRNVTAVLTVDPELTIRADERLVRAERRLRLPAGQVERRILELLADGNARSSRELQVLLGLPMSTVNVKLRRLVELGHVVTTEKRARSPKQRYRRARHPP